MSRRGLTAPALSLCLGAAACQREERRFQEPPPRARLAERTSMVSLVPGEAPAPPPAMSSSPSGPANPYEENAQAIADGKRFYQWFNCVGCHANGGGGMGPPLMDDRWIYGGSAESVFHTIVEGRPNGMPSFAGKLDEASVWKLVAYVRSMSGQAPRDAVPARGDHAQLANPEVPPRSPQRRQPAEHP